MSEKDLLKLVLANQIQIMRRLDRLERKLSNTGGPRNVDDVIRDMKRDNESLMKKLDDLIL
jgi:UDP:flavonoid glycosyltransferase YjiC (YdhE family)